MEILATAVHKSQRKKVIFRFLENEQLVWQIERKSYYTTGTVSGAPLNNMADQI